MWTAISQLLFKCACALNIRLKCVPYSTLRKCPVIEWPLHSQREEEGQYHNISKMISFLFPSFLSHSHCVIRGETEVILWNHTVARLVKSLRFSFYPYRGALHSKPTHNEDTSSNGTLNRNLHYVFVSDTLHSMMIRTYHRSVRSENYFRLQNHPRAILDICWVANLSFLFPSVCTGRELELSNDLENLASKQAFPDFMMLWMHEISCSSCRTNKTLNWHLQRTKTFIWDDIFVDQLWP